MEKILKFNKGRAFNKDVVPEKKSKINIGPKFISDYEVCKYLR